MGVQVRGGQKEGKERQAFMKRLLRDVRALEMMLGNGMIESGVRRIGAEQELFLVNNAYRPACKATEVLAGAPRGERGGIGESPISSLSSGGCMNI